MATMKNDVISETNSCNHVPIASRYALTVEAAAEYFGIGQKKIRALAEDNPTGGFALQNGNRLLIKRRAFEEFLDRLDAV